MCFSKAYAPKTVDFTKSPSPVSVIIASHQNIQGLTSLLTHLQNQSHLIFEIIVALDRTKLTEELRERFKNNQKIRFIEIHEVPIGISPKKNAIAKAINLSSYYVLLFTDDDCYPAS